MLRQYIKQFEWELIFDELYKRDLIDVLNRQQWLPEESKKFEGLYEEKIYFDSCDHLLEIFSILE